MIIETKTKKTWLAITEFPDKNCMLWLCTECKKTGKISERPATYIEDVQPFTKVSNIRKTIKYLGLVSKPKS